MPLLTAMKRTPQLSVEQKALRRAWDTLAEKVRVHSITKTFCCVTFLIFDVFYLIIQFCAEIY